MHQSAHRFGQSPVISLSNEGAHSDAHHTSLIMWDEAVHEVHRAQRIAQRLRRRWLHQKSATNQFTWPPFVSFGPSLRLCLDRGNGIKRVKIYIHFLSGAKDD